MKTHIYLLPLFLFLLFFETSFAQKDTAFWFAPPQICKAQGTFSVDLDTPIYLRISAYGMASSVSIYMPANPAFTPIIRNVAANSTVTVVLTSLINSLETTPVDQVLNTGLKVSASAPISLYYDAECLLSPEIFAFKGQNALGISFMIPGQNVVNNAGYSPTPYNSFDIVATEDNTVVTITPAQPVTGHAAGAAYTETLNHGQTYSAGATSQLPSAHLQGSTVTSTKPIAITVKDDLIDASSIWGNGQDLTGDQIIPMSKIGTEYIAVQGGLNPPYDEIFILGTQNNTTINQDGAYLATINTGDNYGVYVSNPSTYIQTNNPVYVWQLSGLGGELGSGILPPIICTGSSQVAYVRGTSDPLYIMLLVKNGGQNNFQFNGNTTVITSGAFAAVPGTGGQWMAAKFSISTTQLPKDSPVLITNSTNLFHMGVVNGSLGEGGNFGYFSNFNSFEITASDMVATCNQSIALHADSIVGATYAWTGPNGYTSSAVNPIITNPVAADTGTYTLTVSYNTCTGMSQTQVHFVAPTDSTFNLGKDTAYCGAFSRVLATGIATTRWSTGITGPQITVSTPGVYWAQDSSACGKYRDSITITQGTAPAAFNLGNDTSYCGSFTRVLSTGTAPTRWSTGVTGASITVSTLGTYWAVDSNQCGKQSDTIVLSLSTGPIFNLGSDTTYCSSFARTLSTGIAGTLWSTGVTATSIAVSTPGIYWAQDSNQCGKKRDSMTIAVSIPPIVHLGNDTTICAGMTLVLSDTSTNASFIWSTGATTPSITVISAGTYSLQVTQNTCVSGDTIKVVFVNHPVAFDLGNDTIYCGDFSRVLYAGDASTRWNTGVVAASITVSTPGTYIAVDSNQCGKQIDSITLVVKPQPVINLGADESLCAGSDTTIGASYPGATYLWNTGSTDSVITVSQSGIYSEVADLNGCKASDTISLDFVTLPAQILIPDTTICDGDKLILTTAYGSNPVWQDGSTAPVYTVTLEGSYSVTVQSVCGVKSDTVNVSVKECVCKLVIPTAFSPNGDGKNEIYRVLYQCPIDVFRMSIYNRWGEKIFETNDITQGWDGRYKGVPQPIGVFVWMVSYVDPYKNVTNNMSGNVTLLR